MPVSSEIVADLCSRCGMCCNGVLFADVELDRTDRRERLESLGLNLTPKGRKTAFPQPCACFDGTWCRIYADRPARCRQFECRVLQRVAAGKLNTAQGRRFIDRAKAKQKAVLTCLERLGDSCHTEALTRRYARVLAEPIDLAQEKQARGRGALARAMDRLMSLLHREFLNLPE